MAAKIGLKVAAKPDSQDICFVPDGDYARFLERYTGQKIPEGNFVDKDGHILGRHKGITHYTVGQRKGLGLSMDNPVFVTQIRPETGEVVIGENSDVFSPGLIASDLNFMSVCPPAPVRHCAFLQGPLCAQGAPGTLKMLEGGRALCLFDEPVRAITPGQAVVFYDGDFVAAEEQLKKLFMTATVHGRGFKYEYYVFSDTQK